MAGHGVDNAADCVVKSLCHRALSCRYPAAGAPATAQRVHERFGLATIPESVHQLYLFVDNDAGGHLAEERAREAYACEGRLIVTRRPELTGDDWNDVLMRSVRAAV